MQRSGFVAPLAIAIGALVIAVVAGVVGYSLKPTQKSSTQPQPPSGLTQQSPTLTSQPRRLVDDRESWSPYKNELLGFEAKYPPDHFVLESLPQSLPEPGFVGTIDFVPNKYKGETMIEPTIDMEIFNMKSYSSLDEWIKVHSTTKLPLEAPGQFSIYGVGESATIAVAGVYGKSLITIIDGQEGIFNLIPGENGILFVVRPSAEANSSVVSAFLSTFKFLD